jgi:hypothetical protein
MFSLGNSFMANKTKNKTTKTKKISKQSTKKKKTILDRVSSIPKSARDIREKASLIKQNVSYIKDLNLKESLNKLGKENLKAGLEIKQLFSVAGLKSITNKMVLAKKLRKIVKNMDQADQASDEIRGKVHGIIDMIEGKEFTKLSRWEKLKRKLIKSATVEEYYNSKYDVLGNPKIA